MRGATEHRRTQDDAIHGHGAGEGRASYGNDLDRINRDDGGGDPNRPRYATEIRDTDPEAKASTAGGKNGFATTFSTSDGCARGGKWTHVQVGAVLRPFEQSAAVG